MATFDMKGRSIVQDIVELTREYREYLEKQMATANRVWDDNNLRWMDEEADRVLSQLPQSDNRPDKPGLYWGKIQGRWDLFEVAGVAPFLEIRLFHDKGDRRFSPISMSDFESWGSEVPRPPDAAI
jgi:hypothetical protein